MSDKGSRVFITTCKAVGGLTLGFFGGVLGILLGEFSGGWAEMFIGRWAILPAVMLGVLLVCAGGIALGVLAGGGLAKSILASFQR
jgi:hypothetical protein